MRPSLQTRVKRMVSKRELIGLTVLSTVILLQTLTILWSLVAFDVIEEIDLNRGGSLFFTLYFTWAFYFHVNN